jgi:hypothetical protein
MKSPGWISAAALLGWFVFCGWLGWELGSLPPRPIIIRIIMEEK